MIKRLVEVGCDAIAADEVGDRQVEAIIRAVLQELRDNPTEEMRLAGQQAIPSWEDCKAREGKRDADGMIVVRHQPWSHAAEAFTAMIDAALKEKAE